MVESVSLFPTSWWLFWCNTLTAKYFLNILRPNDYHQRTVHSRKSRSAASVWKRYLLLPETMTPWALPRVADCADVEKVLYFVLYLFPPSNVSNFYIIVPLSPGMPHRIAACAYSPCERHILIVWHSVDAGRSVSKIYFKVDTERSDKYDHRLWLLLRWIRASLFYLATTVRQNGRAASSYTVKFFVLYLMDFTMSTYHCYFGQRLVHSPLLHLVTCLWQNGRAVSSYTANVFVPYLLNSTMLTYCCYLWWRLLNA